MEMIPQQRGGKEKPRLDDTEELEKELDRGAQFIGKRVCLASCNHSQQAGLANRLRCGCRWLLFCVAPAQDAGLPPFPIVLYALADFRNGLNFMLILASHPFCVLMLQNLVSSRALLHSVHEICAFASAPSCASTRLAWQYFCFSHHFIMGSLCTYEFF
jgi:hypothetical protein